MDTKTNASPIPDFPQERQAGHYMNPFTDMGFKRIFGQEANKELLLDFLNELFAGEEHITDLKFLDKEMLRGNNHPRGIIYDIFCRTADGNYLIIEMQNSEQDFYPERTLFYVGRTFSMQGESGHFWNFGKLAAVYSINFLNFVLLGKFRSDILLMDRDTHQTFSDKERIVLLELPLFRKTEQECQTDFERWIYILKHMETLQDIPFQPMNAIFKRLAEVTNIESLTPDERYQYETDLKAYRDYKAQMDCAARKGFEKANLRNAKAMKEKGFPVNDIADITGLSIEEIEKL